MATAAASATTAAAAATAAGGAAATAGDDTNSMQHSCSDVCNADTCNGDTTAATTAAAGAAANMSGTTASAVADHSSSGTVSRKTVTVRPQSGKRDYFTLARATAIATAAPDSAVGVPARLIIEHVTHQCSHR
jgi:hypothetical protein